MARQTRRDTPGTGTIGGGTVSGTVAGDTIDLIDGQAIDGQAIDGQATDGQAIDAPALEDGLRATITRRLRDAGQRLTANREVIIEVLADADRPLTIPDILAARRGLAQSSVYRNLLVLEQADVVRKVVAHDEFAHFELAEGLIEHHHHLICSACGSVEDVPASAGLERSLRTAVDEIARTTGFRAEAHRIDLVGLCRRCA